MCRLSVDNDFEAHLEEDHAAFLTEVAEYNAMADNPDCGNPHCLGCPVCAPFYDDLPF